jgi:hypothetical protein
MRKVHGGILAIALLFACASSALAATLFSGDVRCDLDGNSTVGDLGQKRGIVKFTSDNTFTFKISSGLPANTNFQCQMICAGNGPDGPNGANDPVIVPDCGTTDAKGKANFKVTNFRTGSSLLSGPGDACLGPVFILESNADPSIFCRTGFGTGGAGI